MLYSAIDALPQVQKVPSSARQSVQHGDTIYDVSTDQKNRYEAYTSRDGVLCVTVTFMSFNVVLFYRYTFFLEQRRFVESMTKICEELRCVNVEHRVRIHMMIYVRSRLC